MRALIDPRLRQDIPEVWPSKCTIQQIQYTTSASNQKEITGATDILGMKNIPSRIGPLRVARPEDDEQRGKDILETFSFRIIGLNGYFPNIHPASMQAVVDGTVFQIRGVEFDGQKQNTRLKLAIIEPGNT